MTYKTVATILTALMLAACARTAQPQTQLEPGCTYVRAPFVTVKRCQ